MKYLFLFSLIAILAGCEAEEETYPENGGPVMGSPYNDPYYDPNLPTGGGGSQINPYKNPNRATGGGGSQLTPKPHSGTGGGGSQGGGSEPAYRGPSEEIPENTTGSGDSEGMHTEQAIGVME